MCVSSTSINTWAGPHVSLSFSKDVLRLEVRSQSPWLWDHGRIDELVCSSGGKRDVKVPYLPSGLDHGRLAFSVSQTQRVCRFSRSVRRALPRGPARSLGRKSRADPVSLSARGRGGKCAAGAGLPRPKLHSPGRQPRPQPRPWPWLRPATSSGPGPAHLHAGWKHGLEAN